MRTKQQTVFLVWQGLNVVQWVKGLNVVYTKDGRYYLQIVTIIPIKSVDYKTSYKGCYKMWHPYFIISTYVFKKIAHYCALFYDNI